MYEYRKYVILDTSETGSLDFSQILETSNETLRLNLSGSRTFVKYEGSMPSSISALSSKTSEYTHTEILNVLTGSEWYEPLNDVWLIFILNR